MAARAVSDPPASPARTGNQSADGLSVEPLATPKPFKTPRLQAPPTQSGQPGQGTKSPVFPSDVAQQPIQRISYEYQDVAPAGNGASPKSGRPVSQFARQPANGAAPQQPGSAGQEDRRPIYQPAPGQIPANIGQVEVQGLDQLGVMILRGSPQDVEAMKKIIEEIQKISAEVEPYVRVFQLKRATASIVRDTIQELYAGSTGTTSGSTRSTTVQGGGQGAGAQATAVVATPALKRFQIAADDRSNTLVISASPAMMEELTQLIDRLDADGAPIVSELRVFQLKSAEATEVTNILTQAIAGQDAATTGAAIGTGQQGAAGTVAGGGEALIGTRGAVIRFVPTEGEARAQEGGILDTVRVTAQIRTNSVIVSAPASSMPLLAALIAELDKPPSIVADMKVFTLKNSDATNMRQTLSELFDIEVVTTTGFGGGGGFGQGQNQFQRPIAVAEGAAPPVSIRVAIDARTNSLIISGPPNALEAVESVIRYIDGNNLQSRQNKVIRLRNASAQAVATAITNFFNQKRTIENQARTNQQQDLIGAYQRLEQEVVAVAETITNSVLISSSPRFYDSVIEMIDQLDQQQKQVMIQCLIARLDLRDDFEFGLEFGLQSGVLFERGASSSTTGGVTTTTLNPGFNFNNTGPLPNSTAARPGIVGGQGLQNLGLGRSGLDSVGGLILSASSESVSALLRALEVQGYAEIVSRPQIMTLDGRAAEIQVGEQFPYVSGVTNQVTTQVNVDAGAATSSGGVTFLDVGVILRVTPIISPDGKVVLNVAPEVSQVEEIVTVGTIITGSGVTQTITAPRVSVTRADTVVSVKDGQTIVLGGLIEPRESELIRKIPWLGDLPHLGFLFRYTLNQKSKTELLIVLTPHIIQDDADLQRLKDVEIGRANWILKHAGTIHDDFGMSTSKEAAPPSVMLSLPVDETIEQTASVEPDAGPTLTADQAKPSVDSTVTEENKPEATEVTQPAAAEQKPRRRLFNVFRKDK
jgi:type II secretion system protein D